MSSFEAFTHRDFRHFIFSRFLSVSSYQMMMVALGQYVYEETHNPLHLGYLGLALFVPKLSLALVGGHAADRYDRRLILLTCRILQLIICLGLLLCVLFPSASLIPLYALLFFIGVSHAFDGPAAQALYPHLVTPNHFDNAVTWSGSSVQLAFIGGPALAGLAFGLGGEVIHIFLVIVVIRLIAAFLIALIKNKQLPQTKSDLNAQAFLAGLQFVFRQKVILGVISLDLFAVLLGGAVALMPFYANDILHIGATGLAWLRAGPAIGAGLMTLILARMGPLSRPGTAMFCGVGLFGIFTILFGLSQTFWISMICLIGLGASDMISVVVRGVLVQTLTPDAMRGRVNAVSLVFIGASNELGEFESGLTAKWLGLTRAVVLGGVGTVLITLGWLWKFPEIRAYRRLGQIDLTK